MLKLSMQKKLKHIFAHIIHFLAKKKHTHILLVNKMSTVQYVCTSTSIVAAETRYLTVTFAVVIAMHSCPLS